MRSLLDTVRLTLRGLRKRPVFTAVAVLTVALAVAANAAIFGVVDAVLLEPLPFERPRELVTLDVLSTQGYYISVSIPNFRDWGERNRVFSTYGGAAGWGMTLTGQGEPEVVDGRAVVGDFFGVFGVPAALGRTIPPGETGPGADAVVVLGHRFWQRKLGGGSEVLGSVLTLESRPYTVVGVMPPGFGYPTPDTDLYFPMGTLPGLPWDDRDSGFGTRTFARLAPGVTPEAAQSDLDRVVREIEAEVGEPVDRPRVKPLLDLYVGDVRPRLWLLSAAVASVLLIAVVNLTSLLLSRGESRRGEVAVRLALGAGRGAVVRALLAEALLLSLAGGAVGLALAWGSLELVRPLLPAGVLAPLVERIGVDGSVVLYTLGVALVAGVAAALVPALRGFRTDLAPELKADGRRTTGEKQRLRSALVVAEVAMALVLLIAAGLTLQTLRRLQHVDKGFEAGGTLTARIGLPGERYPDEASWRSFFQELEARAGRIQGVERAALSLLLPLGNRSWEMQIAPEGISFDEESHSVLFNIVSEGYFDALGVPLLRGRGFAPGDRDGTLPVAVIDDTMAETFWPGEDPLGRRVRIGGEHAEDGAPIYRTVVGVAQNVRHYELQSPSRIQVYVPFEQTLGRTGMSLHVVLAAGVAPESLVEPLRSELAALDPEIPLNELRTLDELVDGALRGNRAVSSILAAFAALALVLAAVGIFGVVSYFVVQRLREVGIRMALGADGVKIGRWAFLWIGRLAGAGVVLGGIAAVVLTRLFESQLYGVSPLDPSLYGGLATLLLAVAALAAYAPIRRAARVDPASVLRSDA